LGVYVAVAFYSPVHGEEYVERRFRDAARHLPEVLGPFKSADEAPEVRAKALLAVTLTGGTGVAVAEYARRLGVRSVVTLGFPEHNSAASSLSARSYLEAEGVRVWPVHCAPGEDCGEVAARARGIARAVALLTEPRVLLIGRRTAQADRFSAKFGGVVDVMDLDKFAEVVEGSEPDPEFISVFGVEEAAKIYAEFKSLGGGLLGELFRLSSAQSDRTLVDSTCRPSLVPHHVRPDPSYRLNSANSRRCRFRRNGKSWKGKMGMSP